MCLDISRFGNLDNDSFRTYIAQLDTLSPSHNVNTRKTLHPWDCTVFLPLQSQVRWSTARQTYWPSHSHLFLSSFKARYREDMQSV